MSKSCSGKINKTRYDDPGKPMKPTNFTVKNLEGNLLEKQFTIIKRSFRSSTKPLSLDSTIPQMNSQQKPSTALEPLNSSIYERHPLMHEFQYVTNQLRKSQYAT